MKINAIREYYRENQCNTFRSNFPCIFTLVILMPFIVNIISFQITIYGIPVLWYFFYGYLSLIFQRPKNVQVTFLVCPSNVVDFWWVVIVTEFNIVTTRSSSPSPWIIVNWPHPIVNFNVYITFIVSINVLYYTSSHHQY